MKLPKGFGANNMMAQASQAISRMQNLEAELKNEQVTSEQNGVKVIFDGSGELVSLSIDKTLVDPEDVEGLESVVAAVFRQGYAKSVELRAAKTQDIMGGLPDIPGLPKF